MKVSLSIIAVVSVIALLVSTNSSANVFIEQNGLLIFEAESSGTSGDWELETSIPGYAGSGYLRWNGADAFAVNTAGRGTLTFRFTIQQAGNYELLWRSRITRGNNQTEHNDSWVRFLTSSDIPGEQALNGWTKVFMSTLNQWAWQSATVDNVGRRVRQYFSAGEHTIQISGRSNGHAIDRIALFNYPNVGFSESRFNSTPQAPTQAGGSSVEPTPEPPQSENVQAPLASVSGEAIEWSQVEAVAINVHRADGTWITSLPGTATRWQAPGSGQYYLVATGDGPWQTWGRSSTVEVTSTQSTPANGSSQINLSAQVYSSTAIELFWIDQRESMSYEVRRDGQLLTITDGRSYFDNTLVPGSQYNYNVTAIDSSGSVSGQSDVSPITQVADGADQQGQPGSLQLRATAYSQTAIELFWSLPAAFPATTRFQVFENGVSIVTDQALSLFREGYAAGTELDFTVIAIDELGNAVASESVSISTFAADSP